jgi:pimeloyl-ACP methyl ester carboxylesterase
VWTGKGSPTLAERRKNVTEYRAHSRRRVDRDFFRGILLRDKPGTSEEGVGDALADAELRYGDTVPTGTYLDMCTRLPVVAPEDIRCPVLLARGEFDGIASEEDLLEFFRRLPSREKQFVLLPGQAHVSHLGVNRRRFWHVMHAFLTMPAVERLQVR